MSETIQERFRAAAIEAMQRSNNDPESVAIPLRHFIHPNGYAHAYELMRIASEVTGEPLDDRGVWRRGAEGELWLGRVLAMGPPRCTPEQIANGECPTA